MTASFSNRSLKANAITQPADCFDAAVFSIDVEEWFHILDISSTPSLDKWKNLESRVEIGFNTLLEMMAERRVRATCFFLGWIGEQYPHLVKAAAAAGHEIASHGYAHRLVFKHTRAEFIQDVVRSRKLLEDISGQKVRGYRAPGFSCTAHISWFFEELVRNGYEYDASVFPARRAHGGMAGAQRTPYVIATQHGQIAEFPVTIGTLFGVPFPCFGGGYLRLCPSWLLRRMSAKAQREGLQLNFYVHPREVDPDHPKLSMSAQRKFKSYVGLKTTKAKLEYLLAEYKFSCFRDILPVVREKQAIRLLQNPH